MQQRSREETGKQRKGSQAGLGIQGKPHRGWLQLNPMGNFWKHLRVVPMGGGQRNLGYWYLCTASSWGTEISRPFLY